jgi:ribosomal protein L32/predicted RNA-binding Zn-ribbon protein involved in translation (DUF1610 family)
MGGSVMTCTKCGADVSGANRLKDSMGRWYCQPCGAVLRQKAATKLGPTVGEAPPVPAPVGGSVPAAPAADDGIFALADEPATPGRSAATPKAASMQLCPDCGTPLGSGIICINCGYNKQTGRAVGMAGRGTPEPAGSGPATAPRKRPHKVRPCVKCGYDLTGLKTAQCPECGTVNSRQARARADDRITLRSMYVKPAIMAGVGVLLSCGIHALLHQSVPFYLFYFAVTAPVGFLVYLACSIAFIGFDEPLGVTFIRLAAAYAMADVMFAGIDAIPYIGWYAWPFEAMIYTGLLMNLMELDFEDARVVAVITFIVHMVLWFAALWAWVAYF